MDRQPVQWFRLVSAIKDEVKEFGKFILYALQGMDQEGRYHRELQ